MPQKINIFIADDHKYIIIGYKNVINLYPEKKYQFSYTEAVDCKTGYDIITTTNTKFDIALLDISMPKYPEKNINSGEDLAKLIQRLQPQCKIVLLTMHDENLKVKSIIEEIDPLGLIIKNDLGFESMKLAMSAFLNDEKYYSPAIIEYLNKLEGQIYIDVIDKRILHFISKGIIDDDVPLYMPIASSTVVRRIKQMKDLIGMPHISDLELVDEARKNGMMLK
jgi:DNA-binding NarL/FixJ family response regulator